MRKILVLVSLVFLFSFSRAHSRHDDTTQYAAVVKFSLLPFFEIYPALQFGVEHSFKQRFSVAHEIGIVADEFSFWRVFTKGVLVDRIGVRYRFNPRFYFDEVESHGINYFIGPDLLYKYMLLRTNGEYTRYNNSYVENIDVVQHRHDLGLGVKTGFWSGFSSTNFVLEMDLGVGGKLMIKDDNIPADAYVNVARRQISFKDIFLLNSKGRDVRFLFNCSLSLKLGWGINPLKKQQAKAGLLKGF